MASTNFVFIFSLLPLALLNGLIRERKLQRHAIVRAHHSRDVTFAAGVFDKVDVPRPHGNLFSARNFDFAVPVETAGDCYARYRVRMVEFRQSIRIVRQVLDGLPEGPISSRPGVKSVGQVRIPKGEGYGRVEGARGEVGCYLVADGGAKPYRLKWRGASFSNLAILPHILPGHKVADVVAIMGSVDPVFGEVDR